MPSDWPHVFVSNKAATHPNAGPVETTVSETETVPWSPAPGEEPAPASGPVIYARPPRPVSNKWPDLFHRQQPAKVYASEEDADKALAAAHIAAHPGLLRPAPIHKAPRPAPPFGPTPAIPPTSFTAPPDRKAIPDLLPTANSGTAPSSNKWPDLFYGRLPEAKTYRTEAEVDEALAAAGVPSPSPAPAPPASTPIPAAIPPQPAPALFQIPKTPQTDPAPAPVQAAAPPQAARIALPQRNDLTITLPKRIIPPEPAATPLSAAVAAQPVSQQQPTPPLPATRLTNGERVSGVILSQTADAIFIRHEALGVVAVPKNAIAIRFVEVILLNGDTVSGEWIVDTDEFLVVRSSLLGVLTVPRQSIKSLK